MSYISVIVIFLKSHITGLTYNAKIKGKKMIQLFHFIGIKTVEALEEGFIMLVVIAVVVGIVKFCKPE